MIDIPGSARPVNAGIAGIRVASGRKHESLPRSPAFAPVVLVQIPFVFLDDRQCKRLILSSTL